MNSVFQQLQQEYPHLSIFLLNFSFECASVTVALLLVNRLATGLPTVIDLPITTAFLPLNQSICFIK